MQPPTPPGCATCYAEDDEARLLQAVERQLRSLCDGVRQDVREELQRCLSVAAQSPDGGTGSPCPSAAQLRRCSSSPPMPPTMSAGQPLPPPLEDACINMASPVVLAAARRTAMSKGRSPPLCLAAPLPAMQVEEVGKEELPGMLQDSGDISPTSTARSPHAALRSDSAASIISRLTDDAVSSKRSTYAERVRRNRTSFCQEDGYESENLVSSRRPRRVQATRWSLQSYRKLRESTASLGFRGRVVLFVKSEIFDYIMGSVLLANAALLGAQANYFAEAKEFSLVPGPGASTPFAFRVLDLTFCAAFMIEMALRIAVFRSEFFRGDGWKWNWFDLLIVYLQVLDEFVKLAFNGTLVQERFKSVGVIRILRLARLARLVRMVRLIPELKSMVYLIYASFNSFIWSIMLILIVMYCCAIYYTEIVTDMVVDAQVPESIYPSLQERWGNMLVSVLSLWMAVTGGDDWRNFTDVLRTEKLYGLHVVFFVMYIAFGTLVMLNLVTGVFVESAQRIMKEDKDAELVHLASKIFVETDADGSSEITFEEFKEQLATGLMEEYVRAIGVGRDELEHLYELLDQDDSGTVNAGEFVKGCLRLRGPARALDLAEMEYQMRERLSDLDFEMRLQARGTLQLLQQLCDRLEVSAPQPGRGAMSLL